MSDPTIDRLGSAVQDFLSSLYPPVAGATAAFAAQPCGLPVDTSTFASNLLLPAQEINDLADITARVIAGQFYPTLITASGLYEILLSCMPADSMTGDQLSEFGKLRGSADESFHNQLANITATPTNWWDATASSNWTTHTLSSDQVSGTVQPPILPWRWHVLPPQHLPLLNFGLHPGLLPVDQAVNRLAFHPALPTTSVAAAERTEMTQLNQAVTVPAGDSLRLTTAAEQPVATTIAATGLTSPVTATMKPISMVASSRAMAQIMSVASIQTVQAERLSVSFEYCLVTLSRSWWNELFVATKGWYIPTYGAGDLAAGLADGSGGQCPAVPTALFLVRNVSISGSWSDQDRVAIPNAASFGPISLIGRSIDSSLTISIPGMQIIGWMASILPVLPPASDPNLSALELSTSESLNALPTLSSGQQGPAVARLQGLLRAATPGSSDAVLAIDGNYGATTVNAVQAFQQRNGLNASGAVDGTTWQKLLGLS
ncbi:MAG TPA: peptidoglycan-binding domain-containing protein [Ktedonobacteraceae bacterium]|nr:peptidoglycan-binding domain-containing protein [Ktedonobacteraceae bacterium]